MSAKNCGDGKGNGLLSVLLAAIMLIAPFIFFPLAASAQTRLFDNFTQDRSLNSALWIINGPVATAALTNFDSPPDVMVTPTITFSAAHGLGISATPLPRTYWSPMRVAAAPAPPPPRTLASLSVAPANKSVPVGGTLQFEAIGTYSDGRTSDISTQATWISGNPSVATINPRGVAQGLTPGISRIAATLGAISGTTSLAVNFPSTCSGPVLSGSRLVLIPARSQAINLSGCSRHQCPLSSPRTGQLGHLILAPNLYGLRSAVGSVDMTYPGTTDSLTTSVDLQAMAPCSSNAISGYPELIYGYSPWAGSSSPQGSLLRFPIRVADFPKLCSVVNYRITPTPPENPINFAYDIWITRAEHGTSSCIKEGQMEVGDVELMVWLYSYKLLPRFSTLREMEVPLPTLEDGFVSKLPWNIYVQYPNAWPGSENSTCTNDWTRVYFLLATPEIQGPVGVDMSEIINTLVALLSTYDSRWKSLPDYFVEDIELGSEFECQHGSAGFNSTISDYHFLLAR